MQGFVVELEVNQPSSNGIYVIKKFLVSSEGTEDLKKKKKKQASRQILIIANLKIASSKGGEHQFSLSTTL